MTNKLPVLYSFRRCPYAMRARMGLVIAQISVEIRELILRDKPAEMLALSAKATVPVLQLTDGQVMDESLDILRWSLMQSPQNSQVQFLLDRRFEDDSNQLIEINDQQFKPCLDRYKYAIRFPEKSVEDYRCEAETFLTELEMRLRQHSYLCGNQATMADIAIFPFIRQFANVDSQWFENSSFQKVRNWLAQQVQSSAFQTTMTKYPLWNDNRDDYRVFP